MLGPLRGQGPQQQHAFFQGAEGAPEALLRPLGKLGQQRLLRVGVTGVATEAQVRALFELPQHPAAVRAGVQRRLAPLGNARLQRVASPGDVDFGLHGFGHGSTSFLLYGRAGQLDQQRRDLF